MNLITLEQARRIVRECYGHPLRLTVGRNVWIVPPSPAPTLILQKRPDGQVQLGSLVEGTLGDIDWETAVPA